MAERRSACIHGGGTGKTLRGGATSDVDLLPLRVDRLISKPKSS